MNEPLSLHITVNANDPELDCMDALRQVMECFSELESDEIDRVTNWFYGRYRVKDEA